MRGYRISTGRSDGTQSSLSSHSSNPLFQRKRTLDEFPMDYSLQDTRRLLQERRKNQINQRHTVVSTTGECKQLCSYSRRRFETALTIKGERSLPPPSPEERTLFWEEAKPTWTHRRHLSMSAPPVSQPVELTPRPGSGPASASLAKGRPVFNHLRGNCSAYPTIKRLLQESNTGYKVVCPFAVDGADQSSRPSLGCSTMNELLLVPVVDEVEVNEDGNKEEEEKEDDNIEDRLHAEMLQMAKSDDTEGEAEMVNDQVFEALDGEETIERSSKLARRRRSPKTPKDILQETDIVFPAQNTLDEDDENDPASPWHCWVDDATVSSIFSKKSESEIPTAEVTPTPSQAPELTVDNHPVVYDPPEKDKLSVPGGKSNARLTDKRGTPSPDLSPGKRRSATKGKKKGGKSSMPDLKETIELPPPPPAPPAPVNEEVVEEVEEIEELPEPVLPSYICPSSVMKSTQTEIKLWLQKTSFTAANRLLPIY